MSSVDPQPVPSSRQPSRVLVGAPAAAAHSNQSEGARPPTLHPRDLLEGGGATPGGQGGAERGEGGEGEGVGGAGGGGGEGGREQKGEREGGGKCSPTERKGTGEGKGVDLGGRVSKKKTK